MITASLHNYLQYVTNLGFETQPDYKYCKRLFQSGIREEGFQDDGKLTFHSHAKRVVKKVNIDHLQGQHFL